MRRHVCAVHTLRVRKLSDVIQLHRASLAIGSVHFVKPRGAFMFYLLYVFNFEFKFLSFVEMIKKRKKLLEKFLKKKILQG